MENQIEIINQRDVELLDKNRKINLQKLFTEDGINEIISAIESEIKDFKSDVLTKEGRAEIVSLAFKIAKCKAPIKNLASELKEDSRKLIDSVNLQLNRYELAIDKLRDKIRKPVDEIEAEEKRILQEKQDRLTQLELIMNPFIAGSVKGCQELLQKLENIFKFAWGDFEYKAVQKYNEIKNYLELELEKNIKNEAEKAELAQLKKEKEEREKKDREERIAREAVEKAKRDAEEEIKRANEEKRVAEEKAILSDRKAYLMELGLIQDREGNFIFPEGGLLFVRSEEILTKDFDNWLEIFNAAKANLKDHIKKIAEEKKAALIEAEKKAKEDAEKAVAEAIEQEKKRVEEEKRKEAEALEKREANKRHRAKIHHSIHINLKAILTQRFDTETQDSDQAIDDIIEAIAKGEVPHVQINY